MSRRRAIVLLTALPALALASAGCTNPDAQAGGAPASSPSRTGNAGEPPAPAAPSPSSQAPADVQPTPQRALTVFAERYVNWSYRTLASTEQTLAAISVGPARLAEQQAAAASAEDSTIQQGHIVNSGQLISVAVDLQDRALWSVLTREQTAGDSEYEGLPASYHVTLARLQHLHGGYAVSEWLPQS